jgi:predicted RNA-binding protein with PUA-like domain
MRPTRKRGAAKGTRPAKGRTAAKPRKASKAVQQTKGSKPAKKTGDGAGPWAAVFAPRAPGERRYWLVKSEPGVFSFDDLLAAPGRTTFWDGVRNFAARNFLRDGMRLGDQVFFYHSMANPQAIVGVCEVVREGYPDSSALDPKHEYFDAESDAAAPTWYMVDLRAVERLPRPVTLQEIKSRRELAQMALVRIGRLSVTPVTPDEWRVIRGMASGTPG